jgi:formyl-CoA transferase
MRLVGCPDLVDDPESAAPQARRPKLERVFGRIEQWRLRHAKFQAMERLHDSDVPRGPILDMEDKALAERGMIVEVPHPRRGTFKNVGCPIALSDSPMRVRTSPLLGEHTPEISPELLGYDAAQIAERRAVGAI